jgi:hypothetical protein
VLTLKTAETLTRQLFFKSEPHPQREVLHEVEILPASSSDAGGMTGLELLKENARLGSSLCLG